MDIFNLPNDNHNIELPKDNFTIERVQINGKRHYEVKEMDGTVIGAFPSVTSVLGSTGDNSGLERWRKRVGEAEAEKIGRDATERGTVMHRLCELYMDLPLDTPRVDRVNQMLEIARTDEELKGFDPRAFIVGSQLFYNFLMSNSFERVKTVLAQERFLWNKIEIDGVDYSYAGASDNFSVMDDGLIKVIDFKTSKKPKEEKWIEKYKMQGAAYAIAFYKRYGIKANGVEIWISNEIDRFPQHFMMNENDIKVYFKKFLERRREFGEIYK